jgi:hypothetical protein
MRVPQRVKFMLAESKVVVTQGLEKERAGELLSNEDRDSGYPGFGERARKLLSNEDRCSFCMMEKIWGLVPQQSECM